MRSAIAKSLLLLACLGAFVTTARTVPVPTEPIDEWLEQLGNPDVVRRNEASQRLKRLGESALAKVQTAAKQHPLPEVRKNAAEVAASIERGEILAFGKGSPYWFNRVAFGADNSQAIVTGGAVILFDLHSGKEVRRDLELQFARLGLACSPDGALFATGHQGDRVVRVGEIKTGKVTQTFQGHLSGVHAVAFSPNAARLVSGSLDSTLRLWDVKTGKEILRFPGINDQIRSVDYASDGKRVLSGHFGPGSGFLVRLWDADAGKEIRALKGHTQDVTAVFFLPDGKSALSTGMDGAVILWDLDQGKEIRRMTQPGGIYGAALSPDGKRILSAGFGDKTVRLWETATGKELKRFEGHGGAALGVAFSKDGLQALSCDARETVRLWRLPK